MIFASIYPENPDDFENLKTSLAKLKLNDASFTFEPETKESLGRGFKCGFLGSLHAEIISERLKREFGLVLIISTPSVIFKAVSNKGKEFFIYSPSDWPNASEVREMQEPWVELEIISPVQYFGKLMDIIEELNGKQIETKYFGLDKVILTYEVPLKGIITGFYDNLKGVSQDMASMDYQMLDYKKADLVKLEILVNEEAVDALATIVHRENAYHRGQALITRLKDLIPRQLFLVPIQAYAAGRVISRANIKALRKDVLAKCYGGDISRKRKLLEKQKKGKKRMKMVGNVEIPQEAFLAVLRVGEG